jgi:two-component system response regulator CpxR
MRPRRRPRLRENVREEIQMPHVLIADDDAAFTKLLAEYLVGHGFEVSAVHDGLAAIRAVGERRFDVLVLDVMMPRADGFRVLRDLRPASRIPILMLTARGEDVDRIVGLEMGADDYLAKPCNPRELAARLKAILRRSTPESGAAIELRSGDLELSPAARSARVGGRVLDLTGAEFDVLQVLVAEAGKLVSKDNLSRRALNRPLGIYDRSVDMHVSRLRAKLGAAASGVERIKTVRNRGYLFVPPA